MHITHERLALRKVEETGVESFGALMRHYRERAGMSQRALAKLSEINPAIVSRLETGDRMPSGPQQVMAIARALDLSPADSDTLLSMAGYWPSAILALGPQDETLLEIARVLSNKEIHEDDLRRFRAIIHLIAEQLLAGQNRRH